MANSNGASKQVIDINSQLSDAITDRFAVSVIGSTRSHFEPFRDAGFEFVRDRVIRSLDYADTSDLKALLANYLPKQSKYSEFGRNYIDPFKTDVCVTSEMLGLTGGLSNVGAFVQLANQSTWWGSWSIGWLPIYGTLLNCFGIAPLSVGTLEKLEQICLLAAQATAYSFYDGFCFVSARPVQLVFDNRHRLHNDQGAAVSFSDGYELHCWHGTTVPKHVIESKELITVESIDKEVNDEVRRVMIEIYGSCRYITECGAEFVQEDECGTLFAKYLQGDEPMVMVRLSKATLDGTFKHYFLRVPPNTKSARQAVAWSFGIEEGEYKPSIET
jgi:hypothetical protein